MFDFPFIMDALGDKVPKQYHDLFTKDRDDWSAASPMLHISKGKSIRPMLLIYVAGRERHERENLRFAAKLKKQGCDAELFEARNRTYQTLAYNIGLTDDASTKKIKEFIGGLRRKSD